MSPLGRIAVRFAVVAGLLFVACLLAAHDDTWTTVLAFLVALAALVLLQRLVWRRSRSRGFLVVVTCVLVVFAGSSLVKTAWLEVVGRTATATVAGSQTYCTGRSSCERHEEYTLRLADGSTVDGELRGYLPGALRTGDRLDVRYDPTGLVRDPRAAAADRGVTTALAAAALLAGLVLLAGLLLTAGRAPATARGRSPWRPAQRSNL